MSFRERVTNTKNKVGPKSRKALTAIALVGIGAGGMYAVENAGSIESEIRSDVKDAADKCAELAISAVISGESVTVTMDEDGMTRLTDTQEALFNEFDSCVDAVVNNVVEQTLEDYPAPEVSGRLVLEANQGE